MKLYAIIGNPVAHSKSPLIHNSAYKALGWSSTCYTRILLENEKDLKSKIFELGLAGANITVPYKEEAFRICDETDEMAAKIGAVNTIVVSGGKLKGYNTDAPGFIKAALGFSYESVLILGAGGTARALAFALQDKNVVIANRSAQKLDFFRNAGFKCATFDNIDGKFDLIVNSTSAGLKDDILPMNEQKLIKLLQNSSGAIDCIYGKTTPFLNIAKNCNVRTQDGANMLLEQAFFAFEYFFEGNHFDKAKVHNSMHVSIFVI